MDMQGFNPTAMMSKVHNSTPPKSLLRNSVWVVRYQFSCYFSADDVQYTTGLKGSSFSWESEQVLPGFSMSLHCDFELNPPVAMASNPTVNTLRIFEHVAPEGGGGEGGKRAPRRVT